MGEVGQESILWVGQMIILYHKNLSILQIRLDYRVGRWEGGVQKGQNVDYMIKRMGGWVRARSSLNQWSTEGRSQRFLTFSFPFGCRRSMQPNAEGLAEG